MVEQRRRTVAEKKPLLMASVVFPSHPITDDITCPGGTATAKLVEYRVLIANYLGSCPGCGDSKMVSVDISQVT